jgi:hypothetical protein
LQLQKNISLIKNRKIKFRKFKQTKLQQQCDLFCISFSGYAFSKTGCRN